MSALGQFRMHRSKQCRYAGLDTSLNPWITCRVKEPSTWGNRGSESPLNQWLFPDRMEIRAHDWMPSPSIEWRTAMEEYIGLDVSMKETAVSIRRAGERIWRGKCASDPSIVAELIRKRRHP